MEYDQARSAKLAQEPAMLQFMEWLRENGAIFPKVEYPACFSGVNGCLVTEEIASNEAILYIPNKLIISEQGARESEIAEIFQNHDNLFVGNVDRDHNVLCTFVMFERLKGPQSFWHPYFETV